MGSGIKKLAGQTVIYGLGTIVPRLLNYLLTPILTREFLPAEYGINSLLFCYISFLNVVFTYGMETTFFNFNIRLDDKKRVYETALISVISSSVIFSLLLFIFAPLISSGLTTPNAVYPVQFITWSILIIASDAIMSIPFAKLRAENKAMQFSLLKLSNVIINVVLTLFFIVVCKSAYENHEDNFFSNLYNPEIGIGYCFLAMLLANVTTLLFLGKKIISIHWKLDTELLKEMLRYTWPLVILGLAGMVNEVLDRIILKELMVDKSEAQVAQGIYGACYKIAILMTIFIQAFRFAAEPFLFGKSKEKDSQRTYAVIMKYFVIFCLFLFLGTLMNLDWIKYLVGELYWSGLKVVPLLLLANLCLGVVYNLSIWYKLSGQTKFGAMIAIVGALITIIINVIFVPTYSYMACAWATLAAYGGMMIISYLLGQKYYPIKYNLRAMFVYTIFALGLYFLSFTYAEINLTLKIILNNLLVILFAWLVYKLEFANIKKIRANAANINSQSNKPL
ncbi:MAG: polysaccharide biosynthesis protein [Bacteroidetes bacterium]|nr:polysaccharide biosynthesis protein [Bacteroidota bacterium]